MSLTAAQREAIHAEGNVLVLAGAGAGKTSTLVERCLTRLLDPERPVPMDKILMVTFTEAAAAEMRARIRRRLSEEWAKIPPGPHRTFLEEQSALLETAHVSTLHSFCLQLIRQHFHELALDPQVTVLEKEQTGLLMEEVLDGILERLYAGQDGLGAAVQELIEEQAQGHETIIRELVFKLHHYTQTLPDPAGWLERQKALYEQSSPVEWIGWWWEGIRLWRESWLPVLEDQPEQNERARACAAELRSWPEAPARSEAARRLGEVVAADVEWPRGTLGKFRKPIEGFFDEAAFLQSLAPVGAGVDPLEEDWGWVRPHMRTLLLLVEEFAQTFARSKREQGLLDFHDFEQFALQLLCDPGTGQPRPLARRWREKFQLVFVDEYQDINAAQDAILRALSREGTAANRFLVGDVKQSIYRFRLAAPHIFQGYKGAWAARPSEGKVIALADNFRSRERLLQFINPLFAGLMREEIGGVAYDAAAALQFGAPDERRDLSAEARPEPAVEVHLRLTGGRVEGGDDEPAAVPDAAELTDAEREARLVARRLRELRSEAHPIWDEALRDFRPVQWGDMAVLMRSPAAKAEAYAKEFARAGVPLLAARGGFYDHTEVTDLLSLLLLLDNPLQDVPLLAVLRSPLVGLSLDELAGIRLAERRTYFWTALIRWHTVAGSNVAGGQRGAESVLGPGVGEHDDSTWRKVATFLGRFGRWRRMARATALSQRLEAVLNETHYLEWLRTLDRGEQRQANVRRLLTLARQFDPFQRQGLGRFLRFVDAQKAAEVESEPAPVDTGDAVRLTSIHRSKGLEYPVVALVDLGKSFNFRDLQNAVVLDDKYGLCPQVKPPQAGGHYPSLPYWLARGHQRREALGEEMRLLYVALTRARDRLILVGTASEKAATQKWTGADGALPSQRQLLAASSYLDWLGPWWTRCGGEDAWFSKPAGETELFRWRICCEDEPAEEIEAAGHVSEPAEGEIEPEPFALQQLTRRLEWRYPFLAATREPAKTAVTVLRQWREEGAENEAQQRFDFSREEARAPVRGGRRKARARAGELTAAEVGTAHHLFLQLVSLTECEGVLGLRNEAERIRAEGWLTAEQAAALDFEAMVGFWQSEVGRRIRAEAGQVQREVPFTARFSPGDLAALRLAASGELADDEFFIVQGVVDLAVVLPREIWVLDFKTDQVTEADLPERVRLYAPQIQVYGMALNRIYRRPVQERWLHFLSLGRTVSV